MVEPVRVLHIIQRMEAGGTQALLMNLYRNIDRSKVQFDFLVEYSDRQFYDDEIISLGGRIYYSTVREDYNLLMFKKQLRALLKEHPEYKIIHVHAYTIGYISLKTAKNEGVPIRIAHAHSNSIHHDKKRFLKKIMQKAFTVYATDLFACSEEAGKFHFKNKEFKVLQNAIDISHYLPNIEVREKLRKELNLGSKFVVGHVGRFQPEKNHQFLLETFTALLKKKPNAMLLLLGDGPLRSQIESQIQDNKALCKNVLLLGNRPNVYNYLQIMDVFAFPSLYEGLGIVAIEAQSAGIPILCSTGVPEAGCITDLAQRLPLEAGPIKWAEKLLEISLNPEAHKDHSTQICNAGFDINETSIMMEKYYLNQYYSVL